MTCEPTTMANGLTQNATLLQQGAEARIYKITLHPNQPQVILKHRFKKQYRHPTLDATLTRTRVMGEARALMKCLRSGVSVPGIRMVDVENGYLGLEFIEGPSVRRVLGAADGETDDSTSHAISDGADGLEMLGVTTDDVMKFMGRELAKMHAVDVIHGDLTTSNMLLRPSGQGPEFPAEIVLIDFGLSYLSSMVEDKAVDLYVLERAFSSTHPDSDGHFEAVLNAYAEHSRKDWPALKRRLDEVRQRGRKRSMVG